MVSLMVLLKLMMGFELKVGMELEHPYENLLVILMQSPQDPQFLEDSMAQYLKILLN